MIETAPPSDEECPPERYWRRDHTSGYRRRGNRYARYPPERPKPRRSRDGKRAYGGFHDDRYPAREDDRLYRAVDYVDDRYAR